MRSSTEQSQKWLNEKSLPQTLRAELEAIKDDESELYECFYKELTFGTSGMRGIMGPGTNRFNVVMIRRLSQALANYLLKNFEDPILAIGYDSRINSQDFAKAVAEVMGGNGIKVFIYEDIMPVAALSFAIRRLRCSAGVMITASHNPREYNGYKVYNNKGYQIIGEMQRDILKENSRLDIFNDVKKKAFSEILGKSCLYIDKDIIEDYYNSVMGLEFLKDDTLDNISVVYTPLNGAGRVPVPEVLKRAGLAEMYKVPEQMEADGNFSSCPYPNPEHEEVFAKALEVASEASPDIILATDPDCDRVGVMVKDQGEYRHLTGNHLGVLLFYYICNMRKDIDLIPDPKVIKSIVSAPLVEKIASSYGIGVENTLVGFKYIGSRICDMEEKGRKRDYIFGFEESHGYLTGTYTRDKDGVEAALMICRMAAHYKREGKDLIDVLEEIYKEYGYSKCDAISIFYKGAKGQKDMQDIMSRFREEPPETIGESKVVKRTDYLEGSVCGLPVANVLEFDTEDESKIVIRPSGSEPKLKIYAFAQSSTDKQTEEKLKNIIYSVETMVER